MKSTVRIDVDLDNQPIIRINFEKSDDIRDKIVGRFLASFGYKSRVAEFIVHPSAPTDTTFIATIRPLPYEGNANPEQSHYDTETSKVIWKDNLLPISPDPC